MNNYEKIKSMSVDEMAEWFSTSDDSTEFLPCKMCLFCASTTTDNGDWKFIQCCDEEGKCWDGIKQWLLAESEG